MTSNNQTIAYCFTSGHIGFGDQLPDEALMIAKGDPATLREFITGIARHAPDGAALLVPGVPEADTPDGVLHAFVGWLHWVSLKPPAGVQPAFRDWSATSEARA